MVVVTGSKIHLLKINSCKQLVAALLYCSMQGSDNLPTRRFGEWNWTPHGLGILVRFDMTIFRNKLDSVLWECWTRTFQAGLGLFPGTLVSGSAPAERSGVVVPPPLLRDVSGFETLQCRYYLTNKNHKSIFNIYISVLEKKKKLQSNHMTAVCFCNCVLIWIRMDIQNGRSLFKGVARISARRPHNRKISGHANLNNCVRELQK